MKKLDSKQPREWHILKHPSENLKEKLSFDEFTGVERFVQSVQSPNETFKLFFRNKLLDQMVHENNCYNDQVTENNTAWIPKVVVELQAFIV